MGRIDTRFELPHIHEEVLDEEQLRAVFSELQSSAPVLSMTRKVAASSPPEPVGRLSELFLALLEKRVFGAQVHHLEGELEMKSTFLVGASGVRIVRLTEDRAAHSR